MTGLRMLLRKEVLRFWKVGFQTVGAPILSALLYLTIFSHMLDARVEINGVRYTAFLIPGLIMMSALQNAFANSSSSLIQSKVMGSIVFILLSPISHAEFYFAYLAAAMLRGLMVGAGVLATTWFFAPHTFAAPLWIVVFSVLGCGVMASLGIIAGVWADKFDQLAGFQNFLIMPLTMLSGVFYSLHSLPAFWQRVSHFNPVFYMIDGFRYGFFGVSDVAPEKDLAVAAVCFAIVFAGAYALLRSGYKLRY
jgi:ABC-2 type transporter